MKNKFFQYAPYIGLALSLAGIVVKAKKSDRFLICSPMMDDGLAAPIIDYVEEHPGVTITKDLGEQLLRDHANGG